MLLTVKSVYNPQWCCSNPKYFTLSLLTAVKALHKGISMVIVSGEARCVLNHSPTRFPCLQIWHTSLRGDRNLVPAEGEKLPGNAAPVAKAAGRENSAWSFVIQLRSVHLTAMADRSYGETNRFYIYFYFNIPRRNGKNNVKDVESFRLSLIFILTCVKNYDQLEVESINIIWVFQCFFSLLQHVITI